MGGRLPVINISALTSDCGGRRCFSAARGQDVDKRRIASFWISGVGLGRTREGKID